MHDLQIRVRSGGHDYEGLSYVSETPFVIVDLINLRSISVDTANKTAWIQCGAILGEVYHTIATKSKTLSIVAGTCPTVGVGGHFSGGGYGMMSRKFGITADHIIDAKIVDVKGRILDRKSMGEDLFWAIRGGGGASFGIIVSWKVKLVDVPEKVTVFNITRSLEQNATQLVYKWQHIADKVDDNLLIRIFILKSNNKSPIQVSFTALFMGGIEELLQVMQKSFPELGLVEEDCIEMSYIESVLFFASVPIGESSDALLNRTNTQGNFYVKAKSDYVQHLISVDVLESIWKLLQDEDIEFFQMQFSPYGGKLNHYSESDIPFPHRAGNIFIVHYAVAWDEMESSKRNIAWIRKLYRFMSMYVSKSPRATYVNYRDLDLGMNNKVGKTSYAQASIWGMKYFKNNFKRLVQVKTKVDPTNFFRNDQSIPPLSNEELTAKPYVTFPENFF